MEELTTRELYNLGGQALSEENYSRAFAYFLECAKRGEADAQSILGIMYEDAIGVEQNDHKAAEWYLRAAEQGEATEIGRAHV